jgi:iron complex outermembrane recepter protein
VNAEFGRFLREHNLTAAAYNRNPGSATRLLANAWLARPENQQIVWRDPTNQRVVRVIRQAANISSVWIDLLDMRTRYSYNTVDWGTFQGTLTISHFLNYEYADLTGGVKDANGFQNANTSIVPPMPEYKGTFMLNWFRDKHSASVVGNFYSDLIRDNTLVDRYRFRSRCADKDPLPGYLERPVRQRF